MLHGDRLIPAHAGKHSEGRRERHDGGLIPAHAGKTLIGWGVAACLEAHPRSRGENLAEQGWDTYALGSSPLTRGKPGGAGLGHLRPGLIPAHAGKTF